NLVVGLGVEDVGALGERVGQFRGVTAWVFDQHESRHRVDVIDDDADRGQGCPLGLHRGVVAKTEQHAVRGVRRRLGSGPRRQEHPQYGNRAQDAKQTLLQPGIPAGTCRPVWDRAAWEAAGHRPAQERITQSGLAFTVARGADACAWQHHGTSWGHMSGLAKQLAAVGQSIWIDDIRRDWVASGELERIIRDLGVVGMTSNPTIFNKAIAETDLYDADIERLVTQGKSANEIYETLAIDDIRLAADRFRSVHEGTQGLDGWVSLEVSPELAHDTGGTIAE